MSDVFYAGMIPFYLDGRECGDFWCSVSDIGVPTTCDHWTAWHHGDGFYDETIAFTEGTNPSAGQPGLIVECATANAPTPPFQVGGMVRSSAAAHGGTGIYLGTNMLNVYQLPGDAANFRCFIEVANNVDRATGRRRAASFVYESAGPTYTVATYGYNAGGTQVDYDSTTISPIVGPPELVQVVFELGSFGDHTQVVFVNGGTVLTSHPATSIGESGGYQSMAMWWDVEFGSCGDATSPVIGSVEGGERCDPAPG